MRTVHAQTRSQLRGLTLLEVLVALVITSYVVTLLAQALYQAMRIENQMNEFQFEQLSDDLRASMLLESIRGILPLGPDEPHAFQGRARSLTALSTGTPYGGANSVGGMTLSLVYIAAEEVTELQLSRPQAQSMLAAEVPAATVTLLRWSGTRGAFRYLDEKGRWVDEWLVPKDGIPPVLPRAIAIETGLVHGPYLMASIDAAPIAPPSRRQLEAL